ncbi:MAG: glutamine-hydrolyzing GMP synthase [Saprospiraceae bacterium]|nr:glutamine-hydrolyzing GMP synthase [Saprospiraceae bacterium]MBK7914244.1 glutamine-hydrolyzing GMP synthase [Saprospiraceae bacterium]
MDKVIILDFGSQVTQLIARRVRELEIYCEIIPFHKPVPEDEKIAAVILSGSPSSVRETNHPTVDFTDLFNKYPVLGICYGAQLMASTLGGAVQVSDKREYGRANLKQLLSDPIWDDVEPESQVWMSHSDTITSIPPDFQIIGSTDSIPVAAIKASKSKFPVYAFQFHPEVMHTLFGKVMLGNFLKKICGIQSNWTTKSYIDETIQQIRESVQDEHVLLALSGGVDSSVAALIMKKAIGNRLHCFFIDNGLLRFNEFDQVLHTYKDLGLDVKGIDARKLFYDALKGEADPERKRKIIGKIFIDVFQQAASNFPEVKWLCQGTIYPDIIESVSVYGPSVTIKSHHNVGGLPDTLHLKIIEPLKLLFKDEVREVGKALELPPDILNRHPFPGPGLGIRIIGDVTEEKVLLLQQADHIYINNLKDHGYYDKIWQAGAVLLPIHTVGVMGDERTYERVIALRAVNSTDGMTAEFSEIPHALLAKISSEIINQVKGINRVVYDISSKPPATIEWE